MSARVPKLGLGLSKIQGILPAVRTRIDTLCADATTLEIDAITSQPTVEMSVEIINSLRLLLP